MGGGNWTTNVYQAKVSAARAAGKSTFDHTDQIRAGRRRAAVHELLDPLWENRNGPHTGQNIREAMASDDHPNPTPIAIVLDVTGSNYRAAVASHAKLPRLHGLLKRKSYVEDPQILFGAVGDAHVDCVPLQMGQFESDNRMDEQLAALYLEGGGGGQRHETYELAAYYLARHTYLEQFERAGEKGFAFFIGDEMPYPVVKRSYGYSSHTLESLVGDDIEADIPTAQIFAELEEKFHAFFLFQAQGSYREDQILPAWQELIGERALVLEDPAAVCEVIGATLGLIAGGVDLNGAMQDLADAGAETAVVRAAGKALATVGAAAVTRATADGDLPDTGDTGPAERL